MVEKLYVGGVIPAIKLKSGVSASNVLPNGSSYFKEYTIEKDNTTTGNWFNICDANYTDLVDTLSYNSFSSIGYVAGNNYHINYIKEYPLITGNLRWFCVLYDELNEFGLERESIVATDSSLNIKLAIDIKSENINTLNLFIDDNNNLALASVIDTGSYIRVTTSSITMERAGGVATEDFQTLSVISEPGPEPEEGGRFDLSNRFSPRISNNGIGVYPLTKSDVISLYAHLWNKTFLDDIGTLTGLYSNVSQMILSLRWYYGIKNNLVKSSTLCYLTIGNKAFDYSVSTVEGGHTFDAIMTNPIISDFVTYDCGDVTITSRYNNYLDYTETKYQLYLPFIGYVDMNPNDVLGNTINVKYNVNIITGETLCYVTRKPTSTGINDIVVMVIPCDISYECPITYQAMADTTLRFANTFGKAVSVGLSVATGAGAIMNSVSQASNVDAAKVDAKVGAMSLVGQAVSGTSNALSMPTPNVERGSGLGGDTGALGCLTPYFLITRPQRINPDINDMIGKPSYSKDLLSNYSGFTKVDAIVPDTVNDNKYMDEILRLLQAGVYL